MDTQTEGSDSELSDVHPLDSDVERERHKKYSRPVYKEDVAKIQQKARIETKKSAPASGGQKKKEAPQDSLVLDWVFGYHLTII